MSKKKLLPIAGAVLVLLALFLLPSHVVVTVDSEEPGTGVVFYSLAGSGVEEAEIPLELEGLELPVEGVFWTEGDGTLEVSATVRRTGLSVTGGSITGSAVGISVSRHGVGFRTCGARPGEASGTRAGPACAAAITGDRIVIEGSL